jgi:hypothetical protein
MVEKRASKAAYALMQRPTGSTGNLAAGWLVSTHPFGGGGSAEASMYIAYPAKILT